jgi:hypothetical protein
MSQSNGMAEAMMPSLSLTIVDIGIGVAVLGMYLWIVGPWVWEWIKQWLRHR